MFLQALAFDVPKNGVRSEHSFIRYFYVNLALKKLGSVSTETSVSLKLSSDA